MTHPGVLNTAKYKEGPPDALHDARMSHFPITDEQAAAVTARGGIVYDVSVGQGVVLPNGASFFHGLQDGLHVPEDEIFK